MTVNQPKCVTCANYGGIPSMIGGKAKCSAYSNGAPKKVYFEGGNCSKYIPKKNDVKKGTKNGKRKK